MHIEITMQMRIEQRKQLTNDTHVKLTDHLLIYFKELHMQYEKYTLYVQIVTKSNP